MDLCHWWHPHRYRRATVPQRPFPPRSPWTHPLPKPEHPVRTIALPKAAIVVLPRCGWFERLAWWVPVLALYPLPLHHHYLYLYLHLYHHHHRRSRSRRPVSAPFRSIPPPRFRKKTSARESSGGMSKSQGPPGSGKFFESWKPTRATQSPSPSPSIRIFDPKRGEIPAMSGEAVPRRKVAPWSRRPRRARSCRRRRPCGVAAPSIWRVGDPWLLSSRFVVVVAVVMCCGCVVL
mmetsp:Transcript_8717/g.25869  ORF Transcript_8717/g.25869 Transcript_8717/m.25869 type:complete len:234 (-) Transcript_8717:37-738(-)